MHSIKFFLHFWLHGCFHYNAIVCDFEDASKDTAAEKKKAERARVPEMISIQLQPKTNAAWHRVSDIAHNPNLRLKVKSEQTLSTVIETVQKKWVPSAVRYVSFEMLVTWSRVICIGSPNCIVFGLGIMVNCTFHFRGICCAFIYS